MTPSNNRLSIQISSCRDLGSVRRWRGNLLVFTCRMEVSSCFILFEAGFLCAFNVTGAMEPCRTH